MDEPPEPSFAAPPRTRSFVCCLARTPPQIFSINGIQNAPASTGCHSTVAKRRWKLAETLVLLCLQVAKSLNGADRRIEILKSAAAAFRRRGYHGASVDEIASALDMTKGNLYYYFQNKEEILFACHDYSLDKLLALMDQVRTEDTRPDDKLRKLILAFIHMMLDELQGTALTLDLQALSPILLKRIIAKRDRFDHGLREIIQQGIDTGLFRPGDPKMIGFAIMGAVNWITKWFDPAGPLSSEAIGQGFVDYLVGGLFASPEDYSAVSPGFNSNT